MKRNILIFLLCLFFSSFTEAKGPVPSKSKARAKAHPSYLLSYQQLMQLTKKQRHQYIGAIAQAMAKVPDPPRLRKKKGHAFIEWFRLIDEAYAAGKFRDLCGGVPDDGSQGDNRCQITSYAGFTCTSGYICNPILFGVRPPATEGGKPEPICYSDATTYNCYKRTRVGKDSFLGLVFDTIGANEWNTYSNDLNQLCTLASGSAAEFEAGTADATKQNGQVAKQGRAAQYVVRGACDLAMEQKNYWNIKKKQLIAADYSRPNGATGNEAAKPDSTPATSTTSSGGGGTGAVADTTSPTVQTTATTPATNPAEGVAGTTERPAQVQTPSPLPTPASQEQPPRVEQIVQNLEVGQVVQFARASQVTPARVGRKDMGSMCRLRAGTQAIVREKKVVNGKNQVLLDFGALDLFQKNCPGMIPTGDNYQVWLNDPREGTLEVPKQIDVELAQRVGFPIPENTVIELNEASKRIPGHYTNPNDTSDLRNCIVKEGTQGVYKERINEFAHLIQFAAKDLEHCTNIPKGDQSLIYVTKADGDYYPMSQPTKDISPAVAALAGLSTPSAGGSSTSSGGSGAVKDEASENVPTTSNSPQAVASSLLPQARTLKAQAPTGAGTAEPLPAVPPALADSVRAALGIYETGTESLPVGQVVEIAKDRGTEISYSYHPYADTDGDGKLNDLIKCDFSVPTASSPRAQGVIVERRNYGGEYGSAPTIQLTEKTWKQFCKFDFPDTYSAEKRRDVEKEFYDSYKEGGKYEGRIPYRIVWPDTEAAQMDPNPFGRAINPADAELQALSTEIKNSNPSTPVSGASTTASSGATGAVPDTASETATPTASDSVLSTQSSLRPEARPEEFVEQLASALREVQSMPSSPLAAGGGRCEWLEGRNPARGSQVGWTPTSSDHDLGRCVSDKNRLSRTRQQPPPTLNPAVMEKIARSGVNQQAFKNAMAYYLANLGTIKNTRYITIVDYTKSSVRHKRFHVIDLVTGNVESHFSLNGRSDVNQDGYASCFSNVDGSNTTPAGFHLTGGTYISTKSGQKRERLILHGQEVGLNHNSCSRTIVLHGRPRKIDNVMVAATDQDSQSGSWRSNGCPVINHQYMPGVINKIKNGSLFYHYVGDKGQCARKY